MGSTGDVFREQLIKRQATFKDKAIKACLVILSILILLTFILFTGLVQIALLIGLGLFFLARYLMSFYNVEYEYIFTSGELDIDAIYDQTRRKRVFTANMKNAEIMAHIADMNHEHTMSNVQEVRDYSSGVPGNDTYAFVITHNGKKAKVIIEPNEKMLKALSTVISRRNLHLRPGVILKP